MSNFYDYSFLIRLFVVSYSFNTFLINDKPSPLRNDFLLSLPLSVEGDEESAKKWNVIYFPSVHNHKAINHFQQL